MAQSLHSFPEPPEPTAGKNQPEPETFKAEVIRWPQSHEFETLLDEVAMQALLMTTQATGVAIALREGSEMVCRAAAGGHAPMVGDELDMKSGLSGACVQSKSVQICSDTEQDPRVNVDACRLLGVRSILVAPLLQNDRLLGVVELFSPVVKSFGEDDIRVLDTCGRRILEAVGKGNKPTEDKKGSETKRAAPKKATASSNAEGLLSAMASKPINAEAETAEMPRLAEVARRSEPPKVDLPITEPPMAEAVSAGEPAALPIPASAFEPPPSFLSEMNVAQEPVRRDWITPVLTGLVIGLAILFGTLLGMRSGRAPASHPVAHGVTAQRISPVQAKAPDAIPAGEAASLTTAPTQSGVVKPVRKVESDNDAGGLVVYQNDRVVFKLPPSKPNAVSENSSGSPVSEAVQVPSEVANQLLASRVEPQYPQEAIAAKIQGAVGVRLWVDRNGTVQRVRVFSGPPELAQAAVDAVKQWSFHPYAPNGSATAFETTATIDFRLP